VALSGFLSTECFGAEIEPFLDPPLERGKSSEPMSTVLRKFELDLNPTLSCRCPPEPSFKLAAKRTTVDRSPAVLSVKGRQ
jgi:hypothetical protein